MALRYSTELGALDRLKNDLAFRVTRRKIFDLFMHRGSAEPGRTRAWRTSECPAIATIPCTPSSSGSIRIASGAHRHRPGLRGDAGSEREFPGLTFLEADLRAIPLPTGYFDYGICNAVVKHGGQARPAAGAGGRGLPRVPLRGVHHAQQALPGGAPHLPAPPLLIHWLPDPSLSRPMLPSPRPRPFRGGGQPQPAGRAEASSRSSPPAGTIACSSRASRSSDPISSASPAPAEASARRPGQGATRFSTRRAPSIPIT